LALSAEDRAVLAMLSVRPGYSAVVEDCLGTNAQDPQTRFNDILAILQEEHGFIEPIEEDWGFVPSV